MSTVSRYEWRMYQMQQKNANILSINRETISEDTDDLISRQDEPVETEE